MFSTMDTDDWRHRVFRTRSIDLVLPEYYFIQVLVHLPLEKWPPFRRRYLPMHFRKWKYFYLEKNVTEFHSRGLNWQLPITASDNGLAPNRRQAIIWTNADPNNWRIYAVLGGDELIFTNIDIYTFISYAINCTKPNAICMYLIGSSINECPCYYVTGASFKCCAFFSVNGAKYLKINNEHRRHCYRCDKIYPPIQKNNPLLTHFMSFLEHTPFNSFRPNGR